MTDPNESFYDFAQSKGLIIIHDLSEAIGEDWRKLALALNDDPKVIRNGVVNPCCASQCTMEYLFLLRDRMDSVHSIANGLLRIGRGDVVEIMNRARCAIQSTGAGIGPIGGQQVDRRAPLVTYGLLTSVRRRWPRRSREDGPKWLVSSTSNLT
jgi:hypothetical protein